MLLREKALYHQIHPAKLVVDVLTEPVSLPGAQNDMRRPA